MSTPSRTLLAFALTLGAAATSGQDPDRPYQLFVGVDLSVKTDAGTRRPVRFIETNLLILDEPDRPALPLRDAPPFSWAHRAKVSRTPILITDFEQHRAYSLRNDKAMQYLSTQNNMAIYQQEKTDAARLAASDARFTQEIRRAGYIYAELDAESRAGQEGGPPAGYTAGGPEGLTFQKVGPDIGFYGAQTAGIAAADASLNDALDALQSQYLEQDAVAGSPDFLNRMQGALGEEGQDVMELTFTVSSPVPITDAYVVVMGAVKQGEETGVVTFHHPVGGLSPEPRRIKLRKTGFKPGFIIEEVKLHVYAHGHELATNLSERAVSLTRDEAREFLLLSHIADHAVESVPASPVWSLPPPALLAAKSSTPFDHSVTVTIDADGGILSIHESETAARAFLDTITDAAELRAKSMPGTTLASSVRLAAAADAFEFDQTGRVPPTVLAALRETFFLPALDLGTPVPGVATINLSDFLR